MTPTSNQIASSLPRYPLGMAPALWAPDAGAMGAPGSWPASHRLPIAIATGGTGGGAAGHTENRPHGPGGGGGGAGSAGGGGGKGGGGKGDGGSSSGESGGDDADDDKGLGTVEDDSIGPGGNPTLTGTIGEVLEEHGTGLGKGAGGGGATPSGGG